MNSHSLTPSSGRSLIGISAATRSAATVYRSERQTQAYLLSRDTIRRIQRTSSLVDPTPRTLARNFDQPQDVGQRSH